MYSYPADPVEDVKTIVTTYAGVGIVDTGASTKVLTALNSKQKSIFAYGTYRWIVVNTPPGTAVTLCNLAGVILYRGNSTQREQVLPTTVENGVYVVNAGGVAQALIVP